MSAVNLVRYSNALTNSIYDLYNVGVTDATATVPSPTAKTTRLVSYGNADGSNFQYIAESGIPEYQPSSLFTASVFLKNETWNENITFKLLSSNGAGVTVTINPSTLSIGTPTAVVPTGTTTWSTFTVSTATPLSGWTQLILSGITPPTIGLGLSVSLDMMGTPAAVGQSLLLGGFTLFQGNTTAFVVTSSAPRSSDFLPLFSFMNHKTAVRYPQNGTTVQFGGGYVFSAKPTAPPQRIFILNFEAMKWYMDSNNNLDVYTDPQNNIGALDAFYNQVQTYAGFTYNHPMYGPLTVKFFKPLEVPVGETGGTGVVMGIQLELVEQL
jgi:hypothetical protein